jgi:hypothetical protein
MGPEWAVKLENVVIDDSGRLSARKGWNQLNASVFDSGAAIVQLHEYVNASGTSEIIGSTATKLFSGTSTLTDKTGALTPTAGHWDFINFNNNVLGWQASHAPIVYTGSGNFAAISVATGTMPDGDAACAAFGRVWAVDDDKQTIRYSALLDHTRWAASDGGGSINMRNVWTLGMDEVVAITSFGSALIVFGKRHIVFWVDGAGSSIGLNPTNMYINQIIENVGLVARDAFALVGEIDIVFWSPNGVRSLVRTAQEQATPVNEISPGNRDYLTGALSTGSLTKVRMVYSAPHGLVLLSHPDYAKTFCFDTKSRLPDGGFRMTQWSIAPNAMLGALNRKLYFGFLGEVAEYIDYDDDGASYRFEYETGWIYVAGEEGRKQLLKALKAYLYSVGEYNVTFSWWTDFQSNQDSVSVTVGGTNANEWNVMEWGIDEWGSVQAFENVRIPLTHEAEYLKVAITVTINGGAFGVQPFTVYSKPTRLA